MANLGNYPSKYLLFNSQLSKNLGIVLKIEGIPYLFGIADSYTQVRYGDAGLSYGLPGLVYGGLRRLGSVLPYMQLDSGLVIQQKIEPEQGRGNIGNITVSLIDYQGLVSQIVSPGQFVPEIMMGKLCTLYIGFTQTSWPEDYVILYRGFITQIVCPPGRVQLQISDCTSKSRQAIFAQPSTELTAPVAATAAATGDVLSVSSTGVLYQQLLGPDGSYDPTVSTYVIVDSEIMQYSATGILSDTQVLVTRPSTSPGLITPLASHSAGATVQATIGFGFNSASGGLAAGINGIDLALKLLLSGWGGPSYEGYPINDVPIQSFVYDQLGGFDTSLFVLAASGLNSNDAYLDLGLTVGDYFYVSGSASGNNLSGVITAITAGPRGTDVILKTDQTFVLENPTSALVAFRSQYDTFPIAAGVGCKPSEVDVSTFQEIQASYFASSSTSNLRIYFNSAAQGTDVIAQEVMLPLGCYSISRYGRISMAITKPPLPGSGSKLVQLDWTNVLDPDKIVVTRATNQRSFYNQISYEYDYDVVNQTFNSIDYFFDTTSATNFQDTETLPIQSMGVQTLIGGAIIAQERAQALLRRFKDCLIWIEVTVNWTVGSLIEVSDIVLLVDNGELQIMNFATGKRNIGAQLFEVIDRTYQLVSGNVKLKLLGGLGFSQGDRFGLVSPSTILNTGCTTTLLRLTPSFGQTSIANEQAKWAPLVGQTIQVHNVAWSVTGSSVILGVSQTDATALLISPALAFAPTAGNILDIGPYNSATGADTILKALYCYVTPSVLITSGVSPTQFNVAASGAPLIIAGNTAIVRNSDYSVQSPETGVSAVTGSLVTMATALGFTPVSGELVEGIGFADGTGYYRFG